MSELFHNAQQKPSSTERLINPVFAQPGEATTLPRFEMPDNMMSSDTAYQLVHDEAMLDGNSRLNLATFVSTWMDDNAKRLYAEAADKNMIDKDEYPATAAIEDRCWRILADLWNVPDTGDTIGTSAIGSSEACMLGGLALKRLWQERRTAEGKPPGLPNLVLSAGVQVVWEKFCNYWDVEARYVPVSEEHLVLDGFELEKYVDENTIGVVAILGTTFTGELEPVQEICAVLDEIAGGGGPDVPVHVDAASGGFVVPFLYPELEWDFRLPRVKSINASGHKYGLTYPGIGFAVWRTKEDLPEDLVFRVNYLGGDMPTFTLNFSRPGNQVIGQYYNFLRLGRSGYTDIMKALRDTAVRVSRHLDKHPDIEVITDGSAIPVLSFMLKADCGFTVFDVSHELRARGWQVPAYTMPDNATDVAVLRIVVREGFSADLGRMLCTAIDDVIDGLKAGGHSQARPFAH